MSALNLTTRLEPTGPAGAILLSDEQVEVLGGGRRAPVVLTVADRSVRARVAIMGGCAMIGLSRAKRAELGVEIGQDLDVTISLDTAERTVTTPPDLAAALVGEPGLQERFETWSYTRRKEAVAGLTGAKREATRERRLAAILTELRTEDRSGT